MFVKAILKIKLSEVFHRTTNYCFYETELIPNPFFLESLKSNKNLKAFVEILPFANFGETKLENDDQVGIT